jgi:hypothetical protein
MTQNRSDTDPAAELARLANRVLTDLHGLLTGDRAEARIFFPRGIEHIHLKVALTPPSLEFTVAGPDGPAGAAPEGARDAFLLADADAAGTAAATLSVVDDLKQQIRDRRITFDPPPATAARLEAELLGTNAGNVKVTSALQSLAVEVSRLEPIRISSIIRAGGLHGKGRAFDIGNEEVAAALLPLIATDAKVKALRIDEIIFDAGGGTLEKRNRWNYNAGKKHAYDAATLGDHGNHVHLSVVS